MDLWFHILVSGQVQGVGYRNFVLKQAESMQLSGEVRNLQDGRVEIKVRGSEESIKNLLIELQVGPQWSQVSDVISRKIETKINDKLSEKINETPKIGFKIVKDGAKPWLFES